MNREDIIRMAREAGFDVDKKDGTYEVFEDDGYYIQTDRVIKLAALVAAAEREAIARLIEDAPVLVPLAQNDQGGCMMCGFNPKSAASYIRARGNT